MKDPCEDCPIFDPNDKEFNGCARVCRNRILALMKAVEKNDERMTTLKNNSKSDMDYIEGQIKQNAKLARLRNKEKVK